MVLSVSSQTKQAAATTLANSLGRPDGNKGQGAEAEAQTKEWMEAVFYFYIFYFHFLQKYFFVFQIYKNILRPPSCRAAGTWSPRCRAAEAYL